MKYFKVEEFIKSQTASLYNINNIPNGAVRKNLTALMEMLDRIREAYGKPIYINSGYRCEALNAKVGGIETSDHLLGFAADLDTRQGIEENKKLFELIKKKFPYNQLIYENSWIHYSYIRPNKKESLKMEKINGITIYSKI